MTNQRQKPEFWETAFEQKQEMWGFQPANSAVLAKDFFLKKSVKNMLIPGIGYGRNAHIFRQNGIAVTGIEISQTAIEMARKHYGDQMQIHHGSVTDMPFDHIAYDAIFCYALIHLLNAAERKKLIADCYNQLSPGGHMIFTAITKQAATYRTGKYVSRDRYEIIDGVNIYFYDRESVHAEFSNFGLIEISEITENQPFFLIKCTKEEPLITQLPPDDETANY
ncbi:bifunctional 2-polyprenyl-6-hydroxyphenol methylase/3-demethylubiquinol 3-O-methyltransferase UbiG [Pedobacter sp. V48]|uniref:class I SAM-dependent methyltransferase n=1 Tax=Pedobacter sp. V48 TaxID=509635 RepID=UPI0003E57D18|nr:class I SAM-dependent methyltransferase [Pedobacter sp. V48]ETZ24356.1 hypothetical protein N824_12625 [Pedobacter sp. V48]